MGVPVGSNLSSDTKCVICSSTAKRPVTTEDGIAVCRCQACGLVYADGITSSMASEKYYRGNGLIENDDQLSGYFTRPRIKTLDREARRLRQLVPEGGRLLDIGACSGAFLRCFSHCANWTVEGVEPSHLAAKYATANFGLVIHEGFLIEQHFASASFDVVSCLDTIYHIPDPNSEAREIARILKPGGLFAVEIPGFHFRMMKNKGPLCRFFLGRSSSLCPYLHRYFYSRTTLALLLEKHGFKFVISFAEQPPLQGPILLQWLNSTYFWLAATLYRHTNGHINLAPKEFLVFRKVLC